MVYHMRRLFGNPTKTGTESIEDWAKRNNGIITRPRHSPVPPPQFSRAIRWQTCRDPWQRFQSMYRYLQRHDHQWGKGHIHGHSFQDFLFYWSERRQEFEERIRRFKGRKPLSRMQGYDWLCTQTEFRAEYQPNFIVPLSLLKTVLPGLDHKNAGPKVDLGKDVVLDDVILGVLKVDSWARARRIIRVPPGI